MTRRVPAGVLGMLFVLGACRGREAPVPDASASAAPSSPSSSSSPEAAVPDAAPPDAAPPERGDAGQAQAAPQVITRGTRVIAVEGGNVVARRAKGQATPLVLAPAPRDKEAKLSATVGPFLGRADLLDVTVVESSERGWHYESREVHYVLDTSAASDVVACVFAGSTHSGGEYASTSTSIGIKKTAPKPLAFDVARTTTSRATQPRGRSTVPETTTQVEHFELGAAPCASAAQAP